MSIKIPPEFTRSICACDICVSNCKSQPGCLIPGDAERMSAVLGKDPNEFLVASPGATAMREDGTIFRIGTITPASIDGRCILLDENDRCMVHGVAPFGCGYFDCKASLPEAQRRSVWLHRQIMSSPEYYNLRASLPFATSHKPKSY